MMDQVQTDVERFQSYRNNKYNLASVVAGLILRLIDNLNGNNLTATYSNPNYSGVIAIVDTPQNLVIANPKRDRLLIQNIDDTDTLLLNIDADAATDISFQIRAGGDFLLEEGMADKRISVMSSKVGLKFVAIGRVKL